ncbi:arginyl-tRNA--protein transferase 1-like [Uloborus diversus]|uniref:arginyl-tRNA--protein transferase 1-like n=1 Tax=Uloborus diversus TaxID=327109 RepID=UPI00240970A8|nr:arginyl-tRNA--protein transferase 1-like [Uloborus diversus]
MEVCEAVDVQSIKNVNQVQDLKKHEIEEICDEMASMEEHESCSGVFPSTINSSPSDHIREVTSVHAKKSSGDPSKPLCRKAKIIRQERKLQKLLKLGLPVEEATASLKKTAAEPKSLEDFLSEPFVSDPVNKLELRLVPSSLENPLFYQTFEETYSVYKKYQMAIHKDPEEKCSKKQFIRFLVKCPFQVKTFPFFDSEEFMSTFDKSYSVYKKYQMIIHKDKEEECNQDSFEDFLVETALKETAASPVPGYGSFHQQYWLNDRLLAVGVIDILPFCVSSVYFYYDPDFSHLSLGTYAALREIAFTRELNKRYPELQYYYMGFYIHSCVKMRYKGQYAPSFLLCPETYTFKPIENCKPKLDVAKYQRLEEDPNKEDEDGKVNMKNVLILFNKKPMLYPIYAKLSKNTQEEEVIREYAGFVGKKCYSRMLLFRS